MFQRRESLGRPGKLVHSPSWQIGVFRAPPYPCLFRCCSNPRSRRRASEPHPLPWHPLGEHAWPREVMLDITRPAALQHHHTFGYRLCHGDLQHGSRSVSSNIRRPDMTCRNRTGFSSVGYGRRLLRRPALSAGRQRGPSEGKTGRRISVVIPSLARPWLKRLDRSTSGRSANCPDTPQDAPIMSNVQADPTCCDEPFMESSQFGRRTVLETAPALVLPS